MAFRLLRDMKKCINADYTYSYKLCFSVNTIGLIWENMSHSFGNRRRGNTSNNKPNPLLIDEADINEMVFVINSIALDYRFGTH